MQKTNIPELIKLLKKIDKHTKKGEKLTNELDKARDKLDGLIDDDSSEDEIFDVDLNDPAHRANMKQRLKEYDYVIPSKPKVFELLVKVQHDCQFRFAGNGVVFHNGKVALCWGELLGFHDSLDDMKSKLCKHAQTHIKFL